jgi:Fe-S oxidoreductase
MLEALDHPEGIVIPKSLDPAIREIINKFDFSQCMICGSCTSGCTMTHMEEMGGWNIRAVLRLIALGHYQAVVDSEFPWICVGCGRCSYVCPMKLDIPAIMAHMRHLRDRDKVPGTLHKGMTNNLETGNNLAIARDDYLQAMAEMGVDFAENEECPGFYVPVDKKDARILFFPNSKEVYGDFEDQNWWWKIFYAARENWTVPSENWEAVDWALFSANYEANKILAQRKIDIMKNLGVERMIMPDCGGGSYGCRKGLEKCMLEDPGNEIGFMYLYDYLLELIESGRIKLDKTVNEGKTFTWHDSCKHGRELERHYGKGYFDEPRAIIAHCVDHFVEMEPNRNLNYCCGAGGGNWPMPFEAQSAKHGAFKRDQILRSGADVVLVGCSNCRDQMMKRLPKFYEELKGIEVKYIWQLVAESLVIEPWTKEEIQHGEAEGTAQWERLGVDLENIEY